MRSDLRDPTLTDRQGEDLLADLELRVRTDVATVRGLTSQRARVAVTIRAGNAVDRESRAVQAHTTELRRQGLVCIAVVPTMVGSVFHLSFDRAELDATPTLAVCDRCTMLGDGSFESRFQFVQEVDLPAATPRE